MAQVDPSRLSRILAGTERHPPWIQWLLAPGVWLAMLLSVWRASLVIIASGVGLLVFLKFNYLPDITWRQVAALGTGVVWVPIALGYSIAGPIAGWCGVGIIPFALVRWWQCCRAGQRFALLDPARVLSKETRDRLDQGKPLIEADYDALRRQGDADTRQIILLLLVFGICFGGTFIGVLMSGWFGWGSKDGQAGAFFLGMSPLAAGIFIRRERPQLWCGACHIVINDVDIGRLAELRACPKCGKPGPITTRKPSRAASAAWDDELA